jgi:hypothetical protein
VPLTIPEACLAAHWIDLALSHEVTVEVIDLGRRVGILSKFQRRSTNFIMTDRYSSIK